MKPGKVARIDPEYIRHGTSGLIASRDNVTGKIVAPLIQATRTEVDFVTHLRQVVAMNPVSLGEKGKHGILKNLETRASFLSDAEHRIRIIYTVKNCKFTPKRSVEKVAALM